MAELARAEWGLWDDELDDVMMRQMLRAYIRRKKFESRLLAQEVGILLFGNSNSDESGGNAGGNSGGAREVSTEEIFKRMK